VFGLFKKETIFDVAKRTGKKIAFIVFEDKIFITLAEKTVEGKVRLKIYRNYKWEDLEIQIEPSQEFTIHTPSVSVLRIRNVFDYLLDRDYEVSSPSDVFLKIEPYSVEGVIIVYPYEVLSRDSIKLMGLKETGEKEEVDLSKTGIGKKVVPVYSPEIFALDKQSIKMISARSRISQIDTILTMLKDLLVRSEGLMRAPFSSGGGIGFLSTILAKKEFWFIVILTGIAAISLMFFPNLISGMSQALRSATPALPNVTVPKPTFP
jgi:hypothetical protein